MVMNTYGGYYEYAPMALLSPSSHQLSRDEGGGNISHTWNVTNQGNVGGWARLVVDHPFGTATGGVAAVPAGAVVALSLSLNVATWPGSTTPYNATVIMQETTSTGGFIELVGTHAYQITIILPQEVFLVPDPLGPTIV